jgi:hypothetical protein
MIEMIEPVKERYGEFEYDKSEVDNLLSFLIFETGDLTGKTVYIQSKQISQNKLREKGFSITRSKDKADFIVINDLKDGSDYGNWWMNSRNNYLLNPEVVKSLHENVTKQYKHVYIKDIYKYLYSYEGNLELYESIDSLLKSKEESNTKMAMEFMSNANWDGNEIYLMDLFYKHWFSNIRNNSYKTSISFKGFLESLPFDHDTVTFHTANQYRAVCKNDEHHDFVFNKFKDKFKEELDALIDEYKIQIDKLEYSIDKSIINP